MSRRNNLPMLTPLAPVSVKNIGKTRTATPTLTPLTTTAAPAFTPLTTTAAPAFTPLTTTAASLSPAGTPAENSTAAIPVVQTNPATSNNLTSRAHFQQNIISNNMQGPVARPFAPAPVRLGGPQSANPLSFSTPVAPLPTITTPTTRLTKSINGIYQTGQAVGPPMPFQRVETKEPELLAERRKISPIVRHLTRINPQARLLHRVVMNILTMLTEQGYIVPTSLQEIKNVNAVVFYHSYLAMVQAHNAANPGSQLKIRDALSGLFTHKENGSLIYVYHVQPDVGRSQTIKGQLTKLLKIMTNRIGSAQPINKVIMIADMPMGSSARKELDKYPDFNIKFFITVQLAYLPSHHFLSPKYEKIDRDQIQEELKVKMNYLKTVAIDDPVIKELGFEVGDILRITRINNNWTHPVSVYVDYRKVTNTTIAR